MPPPSVTGKPRMLYLVPETIMPSISSTPPVGGFPQRSSSRSVSQCTLSRTRRFYNRSGKGFESFGRRCTGAVCGCWSAGLSVCCLVLLSTWTPHFRAKQRRLIAKCADTMFLGFLLSTRWTGESFNTHASQVHNF